MCYYRSIHIKSPSPCHTCVLMALKTQKRGTTHTYQNTKKKIMRAKLQPSVVWKIIFYNKFPYLWYLRVWTHFLHELLSIRRFDVCLISMHWHWHCTHTHSRFAHMRWLVGLAAPSPFAPAASSKIT